MTLLGEGAGIVWLLLCLGVEVKSLFGVLSKLSSKECTSVICKIESGKRSTPFITHLSSDQINVNIHDGVL